MAGPPAVARVLERVTATAREHAMFLPGDDVLVAVSGGPDSLCLLHSLHRLRRLLRIRLQVFHYDHRLRRDSAADAAYVRRIADRLGLAFHLVVADSKPPRGESIEAWARGVRLRAQHAVALDLGTRRIAEGHTVDDQAETLLLALIRGGGLPSMTGIRPTLGYEVQPLLDVTRDEVESFCRALRLRPRMDPTNRDTRFQRNAVRLRVLPAIERAVGRDVRPTLARTATLLRADEEELRRQASAATDEIVEESADGIEIEATALTTLSPALAGRVVRQAMLTAGVVPTEEAIEGVVDLAEGRPGRRRDLPDGLKARRERRYVLLSRSSHGGEP
jgi:tRNA(Ile)-lysidine synthase